MDTYQAHALDGASGVELTIALYDGIIRFMHNAIEAAQRNDVERRRAAVKASYGHRDPPAGDAEQGCRR